MELGSRTRRIDLVVLTVVAVVGATLAIPHRGEGHSVFAAQGLPKQAAEGTANQPNQPQSLPSKGDLDDATAFASIAENEVSQLHEGITLDKWMDTRGKGAPWARSPLMEVVITDPFHQECLSLVKSDALPSGAKITVQVSFYPPPTPSRVAFPTLRGQDLINTCTLGMIRIEAEASSPEIGKSLDEAVRKEFDGQYGPRIGTKGTVRWGRGVHSNAARWMHGAEIVSGYDGKPGLNYNAPDQLVHGPVAFVRARLPLVEKLEHEACCEVRHSYNDLTDRTQFRRAVAATEADAGISQRMEKLYDIDTTLAERLAEQAEEICKVRCVPEAMPKPTGSDWKDPLVPLLQEWFNALKNVDARRRAAGLLAADRLLLAFGSIRPWDQFGSVQSSTQEQSKRRSELQGLGATFEPGFADAFFHYTSNWLNEAKQLDHDSEGGQMALVTWMSSGDVCNRAGSDSFRQVISEGEDLLTRKIDADTAAQVHFMVGDAYSDIVAIAGGYEGPNGEYDAEQFHGEAISARAKALQHYRAGLAIDNSSENAKDAYRQAWHLATGLLPRQRYVCFGD
jgi:hypothetical protein